MKRKPRVLTDNLFQAVSVLIPRTTWKIVEEMSIKKQMPMSRLIAIAVDNELDSKDPFNYPTDLPTEDYVEFAYAKEAGVILKWLTSIQNGVSQDTFVLARREFGIDSRKMVLAALRELFEKDMIEEFRPRRAAMGGYAVTHKRIRIKGHDKPSTNVSNREEVEEDEQS